MGARELRLALLLVLVSLPFQAPPQTAAGQPVEYLDASPR